MANKNTRIDVEVNTQNAKNQIRELSNEVSRVNNLQSNVNIQSGQNNSTSVQPNQNNGSGGNIERAINTNHTNNVMGLIELIKTQSQKRDEVIKKQYDIGRKNDYSELQEFIERNKNGTLSDKSLETAKKGFLEGNTESYEDERQELSENQRITNELIEELISRQDENTKNEIVESQRDNSEIPAAQKGILRSLFEERSSLMTQRLDATSEAGIKDIDKKLSRVNKDIYKKSGNSLLSDTLARGGDLATSLIEGNAGSLISSGKGLLSKVGTTGIATAAIVSAIVAGFSVANARTKQLGDLTSYRALGGENDLNNSISSSDYTKYGIENAGDFLRKRKDLLLASGVAKSASNEGTLNAIKLERGYGVDNVAELSHLERQDKYSKSTSENIIEMINVLGAIKDGSISKEDFTLVNEKTNLMNRLQQEQVSRQEKFDGKQILGLMTAFEKMGGEGKDQRASEFISGTLSSMREGGSQNMMLLKHKFAIDARPDLANDPAGLSRLIEEGTDSNYIASTLKGLNQMSGGNKQNKYFLFKEYFQSLTPSMREKLMKAGQSDEILGNIKGMGLTNSGIASFDEAGKYAESKVPFTEEAWNDVKKTMSEMVVNTEKFTSILGGWIGLGAPVKIENKDKSLIIKPQVPK